MDIPGLSMDGHCYSGIRGYSDKGGGGGGEGWTSLDYPWMVTVTLASADTLTRGGGEGWTSLDYPWMVTVTLASADTLTRGGGGEGGHPWTIHRWSYLVWAYADICPSKVLGNTKVTVSSMDDSGLSTAPLDYPLILARK